jgi:hypothetical protein
MPPRVVVVIVEEEGVGIEHLRHIVIREEGTDIKHLRVTLMSTSHCQPSPTLRHRRRSPRARGGAPLLAPYAWPRGGEAEAEVPIDPPKLLQISN